MAEADKVLDGMELHYPGNLVGKIEGQIVGPNRMREMFVIQETEYDSEKDRTTARVRFATQQDFEPASE